MRAKRKRAIEKAKLLKKELTLKSATDEQIFIELLDRIKIKQGFHSVCYFISDRYKYWDLTTVEDSLIKYYKG